MSRVSPPAQAIVLGAAGLVLSVLTAGITLGSQAEQNTSYATSAPGLDVASSVVGAVVFAAAALLAAGARTRVALATFGLGLTWLADAWAGSPDVPAAARTVAMLLVPMMAPAALLVTASMVGSKRAAGLATAVAAVGVGAGIALWLSRDPVLDLYCWRDCLAHSFALFPVAGHARTATHVVLVLGAACGALTASLWATRGARRAEPWAAATGIVLGCALATSALASLIEPAEDPARPLFVALFWGRGLALAVFAGALCHSALRPRLVRRAITRLAGDPERLAGGLASALAEALGDSHLFVGYPLPDGPTVDVTGRLTSFPAPPARILRGGELVALVGSATGTPPAGGLERALGPAARLALANERLRSEDLFRLRELSDLRRRIVATGDAARRGLERDLHDGAQQRLLTVGIDLRVALRQAEETGRDDVVALLRDALDEVNDATAELRAVAHGIFPAALASSGLAAALDTLADQRPLVLSCNLPPGRRFSPEVETAAYAVVADSTENAERPVRVHVEERASELVVTVDDAVRKGNTLPAEDRVGATDGWVRWEWRRLEAVLPVPPPLEALAG